MDANRMAAEPDIVDAVFLNGREIMGVHRQTPARGTKDSTASDALNCLKSSFLDVNSKNLDAAIECHIAHKQQLFGVVHDCKPVSFPIVGNHRGYLRLVEISENHNSSLLVYPVCAASEGRHARVPSVICDRLGGKLRHPATSRIDALDRSAGLEGVEQR
jgi:hypothetical protein